MRIAAPHRLCLKCDRSFASPHGDRLCPACNKKNAGHVLRQCSLGGESGRVVRKPIGAH